MERLELKHIQHYPIGTLKVVCPDNSLATIVGITTNDIFIEVGTDTELDPVLVRVMYDDGDNKPKYDFATWGISQIKLILHSMTDLYKPLEDGSIPIIELAKLATESYGEFEYTLLIKNNAHEVEDIEVCCSSRDLVDFYFKYSSAFSGFAFFSKKVDSSFKTALPVDNQLKLFEYLFKHHFDVYKLIEKGLAIDIKNN